VPYGAPHRLSWNDYDLRTSAPSHFDNINHTASVCTDGIGRNDVVRPAHFATPKPLYYHLKSEFRRGIFCLHFPISSFHCLLPLSASRVATCPTGLNAVSPLK
jgi:hypothetical protein